MEAKIVVGTKDGKSYNVEVKEDLAAVFVGKHIGDVVNVTPLGLKGYDVRITGGSDKQGFPMRKDLHTLGRSKALMSTRTQGYKPSESGVRVRKTVVGDIIDDRISQINTVVVKEGKDKIEKLLGLGKEGEAPAEGASAEKPAEAPKAEAKPEAPKEEKKEEKPEKPPKEEAKEEPPKEEPKEGKPAEEKKEEAPAEEKKEESSEEKSE